MSSRATFVVLRADGLATIQDDGRRGRMHEGVPAGGPLVPPLFHHGNAALGNARDAPAIEHAGKVVLRAEADATIHAGGRIIEALAGQAVTVPPPATRVDYICFEGGLVAPVFLGGRGALLALGHGRIVAGQRLETAARPAPRAVPPGALDGATGASTGTIALAFGPDPVSAALREAILSASFHVSPTSDRAGTRLAGPDLPVGADASATSRPMVRGGVQLTRAGLIVLGPDHPTTGGYPLVAVVPRQDQAALFALRVGARLRFVEAAASTS